MSLLLLWLLFTSSIRVVAVDVVADFAVKIYAANLRLFSANDLFAFRLYVKLYKEEKMRDNSTFLTLPPSWDTLSLSLNLSLIGEIVGFYRGGCAKYIRMKLMDAYDWLPA